MNSRGGSGGKVWAGVGAGALPGAKGVLTFAVAILIVPCFIVVDNCHCVSGRPSPSVSRVTAYYDPTWKTRTKRTTTTTTETTPSSSTSTSTSTVSSTTPIPFFAGSESESESVSTSTWEAQAQSQPPEPEVDSQKLPFQFQYLQGPSVPQELNSNINYNYPNYNNFNNYNYDINNTYFPVPPAPVPLPYQQQPYQYTFPYPPIPGENSSSGDSIAGAGVLSPNKINKRRRKRLRNGNNESPMPDVNFNVNDSQFLRRQSSPGPDYPVPVVPFLMSTSMSMSTPPAGEFQWELENQNENENEENSNPSSRTNRRRRLTRRKKIKNRYFRPQDQGQSLEQGLGSVSGHSEIEPENLVNSAAIEPFDSFGYNHNYPILGSESLENTKFQGSPSPLLEPEVGSGLHRIRLPEDGPGGSIDTGVGEVMWSVLTEAPEIKTQPQPESGQQPERKPTILKAVVTKRPATSTTVLRPRRPNGNNVVIYQRGTPNTPNYSSAPSRTTPMPGNNPNVSNTHRRRKIPRNRNKALHGSQSGTDKSENENQLEDLSIGESFNPFLNSSTPISSDLRNSLFTNLELNLLHPLFNNADASLKDASKIPENKTIGIKHMLSDTPVSVQIAADLHMDSKSQHSLLSDHDSIISSDYERQVYKTRPRIQVKTSVSMSTSTTVSSPSTPVTSHSHNHKNKNKNNGNNNNIHNIQIQPHGNKYSVIDVEATTPMPSSTSTSSVNSNSKSKSPSEIPSSTTTSSRTRSHQQGNSNDAFSFSSQANSKSAATTSKPMITLEDMFALFPNVAEETGTTTTTDTQRPSKTNNSNFPNARTTKVTPVVSDGSSGSSSSTSRATTYKPSFASSIFIASTGSTTSTPPSPTPRQSLPLTTFAQTRGKATSTTTTTTTAAPTTAVSPLRSTYNPIITLTTQPKTKFTLRPKGSGESQSSSQNSRTRTTVTPTPTTLSLTFPTVAPTAHDQINTFFDSIDENAGKNTWTPSSSPSESTQSATQKAGTGTTTTPREPPTKTTNNNSHSTRRPTEKIKINKDPPLILMPPFTNDKEEPKPVTLTTPEPVTTYGNVNNNNANIISNENDLLLKQLLGELGISGADLDILNSSPKPPPSTTVKKPSPDAGGQRQEAQKPVTAVKVTTTAIPIPTTTTTKRPTTVRLTTPLPPPTTQADLFNLFNLFAPQTSAPQLANSNGGGQGQRPLTTPQANEFLNLLNLFQPSTPPPRTVATSPPGNDLFNLFNLFQQPQATQATTRPAPPPSAQSQGGLNDLFNIFNLFTTPPPAPAARPAPVAVAPTTRRPSPPQTPAPAAAGNDILSLLNLLQPQATNQHQSHATQQQQLGGGKGEVNAQADLEALVQQALLESLGLGKGGGGGGGGLGALAGLGGLNLFSPQATNINQQLINPSLSPGVVPGATGSANKGLSDADLKSIYAMIDKQNGDSAKSQGTNNNGTQSASTTVTTPPPPSSTSKETTTLMPIFRNMLNLFGITDPTSLQTSLGTLPPLFNFNTSTTGHSSAGPVYNQTNSNSSDSTSGATTGINENDLLLQLINASTNKAQSTDSTKAPSSPASPTSPPASSSSPDPSLDILSQLLSLGQVVENTKATAPVRTVKETNQGPFLQLQQQQQRQPALDIQSILAQSWLANSANAGLTSPKPEVSPSESNLFNIFANQFTPRPARPNGLYYWVDLNAFMGEQGGNPLGGIRPKLGHKDYFLKVKRETNSDETTGKNSPNTIILH